MLIQKTDAANKFVSIFNTDSGEYFRSGVLNEAGEDTNVDPFMASFPELLDIGIMGHCTHMESGLCKASGIECYQRGPEISEENMTLENFKKIIDECKGKTFQVALGGRGDPNLHENFEEMVAYCRENDIVPNFTTSGIGMTRKMAEICAKYCGAVAVSWHNQSYTHTAIRLLLTEDVKTNIHYVLSNHSLKDANLRLCMNFDFPKNINALVFLLHKPVGLGTAENMLSYDDPDVQKFFKYIDEKKFPFKVGFDSCSVPCLLNMTSNIDRNSIDTCEAARWSAYITPDMKMLPCSFDNQAMKWAYDISNDTIQNAWNSDVFEDFRNHLRSACPKCKDRAACMGGCPIVNDIVLCNRKERKYK